MFYTTTLKTITLKVKEDVNPKNITTPAEVFTLAQSIFKDLDDDQEHFVIFFLNNRNTVNGFKLIGSGGQNSSLVDPKVVFRNSLLFGAAGIILCHNHPSGQLEASVDDITFTQQLKRGAEYLDIKIVDHLIINKTTFFSFQDNGLLTN